MELWSSFSIQACDPETTGKHDENDSSISEASEYAFQYPTENAILFWGDCYIPLCYKYEVGKVVDEILYLLGVLSNADRGHEIFNWGLDTFKATWTLDWGDNVLELTSSWMSVRGPCLERLKAAPRIQIHKLDFICEWRKLLEKLLLGLKQSGYDETQIPEMTELSQAISAIPEDGRHYKESLLSERMNRS